MISKIPPGSKTDPFVLAYLVQQRLQLGLLTYLELPRDDSRVVDTKNRVNVLHGLRSYISKLLDLGSSILDLVVGHLEVELLHTRLDGVPTGESVTDRDISAHTEVSGVEDLVSRGVGKDSLGVDTSLVGEGAETGDVVVAAEATNKEYSISLGKQCYTMLQTLTMAPESRRHRQPSSRSLGAWGGCTWT